MSPTLSINQEITQEIKNQTKRLQDLKTKVTPTTTSSAWCIYYGKSGRKFSDQNQIKQSSYVSMWYT